MPGVEDCIVIPAYEGSGTVKLVIIGSSGEGGESLVQAVYDAIMCPGGDASLRRLPTGCAKLLVVLPELIRLSYRITGVVYDATVIKQEAISPAFTELLENC